MFYQEKATSYETHTRIIMGIDCTSQLVQELQKTTAKRVMILSGRHVSKTNFYRKCINYIQSSGVSYFQYSEVDAEAPVRNAEAALEFLKDNGGADLLIAIGGGSVIDLSKCVAILATNGGSPLDWKGYEKFHIPPIPLFSVPTTAGTASEVTAMAIIHDETAGEKFTIGHRELNCSKVAFLDPNALLECPRSVIADSGIDALSHSLESFLSLKANPMTDAVSLQGIRMVYRNLPKIYANTQNQLAALDMFAGSTMGGMAFTTTGTGHMHGIGRWVGPQFHISHGLSIAFLMAEVVRFNALAQPEKMRQIAEAMDINCTGKSDAQVTDAVADAIYALIDTLHLNRKLKNFTATPEQFDALADNCVNGYVTHYYAINPRVTDKEDYLGILEKAYHHFKG